MKTRCPHCQTSFRILPEQLRARTGKVRCGRCKKVFNALDSLDDERSSRKTKKIKAVAEHLSHATDKSGSDSPAESVPCDKTAPTNKDTEDAPHQSVKSENSDDNHTNKQELEKTEQQEAEGQDSAASPHGAPKNKLSSQWTGSAFAYSKPTPSAGSSKPILIVMISVLSVLFIGQFVFHHRTEISLAAPKLHPLLQEYSRLLGQEVPLPRQADFISIEASDLQKDPARDDLLNFSLTLRNRAPYNQAFPVIEISLTDTHGATIVRRVLHPNEYLPYKALHEHVFSGNSDIAIQLWLETLNTQATGYRLYAFYP